MIRRALTLVELMLSLAILAVAGLALSSMLAMVGTATQADREGRSVLLRSHAAQTRLRAYLEPSQCVLQHDAARGALVVWLADTRAPNIVNATEMRVLWFDSSGKTLTVERVEFPEAWSQTQKDAADINMPASTDFAAVMIAFRSAGYTKRDVLARSVRTVTWGFNVPAMSSVQGATRVRVTLGMETASGGVQEFMTAMGLAGYRAPVR
ncbi:MAG: hypothetical protein AB7G17_09745 [Phycisphaerales bacterium]